MSAPANDAVTSLATARERAEQLFLQNQPAEALPEFQEAIRNDPQRPQLYVQLAVVYEQLGQPEQAEAILRQGLDRNPGQGHIFYHNMAVQRIRSGDLPGAERLFLRSTEHDASFGPPWRNLGNIAVESGAYTDAIERYERYLALSPQSSARDSVERMIARLNALLQAEEQRIEAEERERAEIERRRRELQDAVRRSLEESRREAERSGGGEEGFESIDDDFDIFD